MSLKAIKIIFIILGALYFFSWIDLIPDRIHPLLGKLDDIVFIGFLMWRYRKIAASYAAASKNTTSGKTANNSASKPQRPFDPFGVLGVTKTSSAQEIDAAYRKLMSQYHPDKVSHLGAELQRVAHEKTLEIQKAYGQIRREA